MSQKRVHSKRCEICGARSFRKAGTKRFFMARFPVDEERCKQWLKFTGKEDLLYFPIKKLHMSKHICENHFELKDFNKLRTRLRRTAVPCKNLKSSPISDEMLQGFPYPCKTAEATTTVRTYEAVNLLQITATSRPKQAGIRQENKTQSRKDCLLPAETKDDDFDVPCDFDDSDQFSEDSEENYVEASIKARTLRDPKQVLQLRLLEHDECDEPLFEVLPEEQPVAKVSVTTQIAEIDLHSEKNPPATEPPEVKVEVEECGERQSWKQKLAGVLHSRQFCGVCLSVCGGDDLSALSDRLETRDGHCATYGHVLETVFKENYNLLANAYVCRSCTEDLIKAYTFIRKAEETWKTLNSDLDELYSKTCYIRNSNKKYSADSKIYNVVIALDRGNAGSSSFNNMNIEDPKSKQNNLQRSRDRRKYKCLSCDLSLPSYSAWKIHAAATHGNDHRCRICLQSYKTRHDLTAHYRTHIKSRCPVCHRTVQDGGLVQHLRRRHKRSVHLCGTCDVACYSARALERHRASCHSSGDSTCATCLRSLPRAQLAEHRCQFGCPACGAAACAHRPYLAAYRRQAANLQRRVRCAHCRYVCCSSSALVAHADERHLHVQPYSCASCGLQSHRMARVLSHVCAARNKNKRGHICLYCDRPFASQQVWQRHRKECERIQRQFQCDYCPANFDSATYLSQHRRIKHSNDMFSCDFCDRVFLNLRKKNKHTLQVHSGSKWRAPSLDSPRSLAVCDVCGAVVRRSLLKKHASAHSRGTAECATCGKCFQSEPLLRSHQKRHLRNMACPKCKKVMSSSKLWRHFRNHLIRSAVNFKTIGDTSNS